MRQKDDTKIYFVLNHQNTHVRLQFYKPAHDFLTGTKLQGNYDLPPTVFWCSMNITRNSKPRSAFVPVSPRQAVLAQWRGIDLAPLEQANAPTAQTVKALMPKVLGQLGLERRCAETEIVKVWNHLIDPNIVAHAQPTGFERDTLRDRGQQRLAQ